MRLLYFSPRDCWPTTSGARLRDFYLSRELVGRGFELTYLGFNSGETSRQRLPQLAGAETILIQRGGSWSPSRLFRGFLGPQPVTVLNYEVSAMKDELQKILIAGAFDAVQIEGVHLAAYIPLIRRASPDAHLNCDWHNIESELIARYGETAAGPRALYARRTASLLRRVENEILRMCDSHTVCSGRERDALIQRVPSARIQVVGNGVDSAFFSDKELDAAWPRTSAESDFAGRNIVFVGSMDYRPNIDAAVYFARQVWPAIRVRRPELRFAIVGSKPSPEVLALREEPGVVVTGTVDDIRPWYRTALVSVIPVRVGSGTRLKALEAMAAGIPVISTTLGVEGLACQPGLNVLIADRAEQMADEVARLDAGGPEWTRLAANGRSLVEQHYDWSVCGQVLAGVYESQPVCRTKTRNAS